MGKILLVIALFAILVYGTFWLLERRRAGRRRGPRGSGHSAPNPPRRTVAPDDDPDFLRDLERKRRREQRDNPE